MEIDFEDLKNLNVIRNRDVLVDNIIIAAIVALKKLKLKMKITLINIAMMIRNIIKLTSIGS